VGTWPVECTDLVLTVECGSEESRFGYEEFTVHLPSVLTQVDCDIWQMHSILSDLECLAESTFFRHVRMCSDQEMLCMVPDAAGPVAGPVLVYFRSL